MKIMKIGGSTLAIGLSVIFAFMPAAVKAACWNECFDDPAPGWLCRRQSCGDCREERNFDVCPNFCDACPYSVYSGATCDCPMKEWDGDCFEEQIGFQHEMVSRLDWYKTPDPFGYASRRTYLYERQPGDPLTKEDNTMIAGVLYTLSERTLKMSIILPPLYESESRQLKVSLFDENGNAVDGKILPIKDHTWHASYRLSGLDESKDHSYLVEYKALSSSPSYTLRGSIPKQVGYPKVAAVGCFGQDSTTNKEKLVAAIQAQQPDLIVLQGDQTYFHQNLLYGTFETIYGMRDLLKDLPVIVQMDDHDYGSGNLWGGENVGHNSGVGFVKPPCLVNLHQELAMGHNPDSATTTTLENGITIHYANYIYHNVDFAILEARKFKNFAETGTLLGPEQENWLRGYCNDRSRYKVVLTQSPFSNLATNYIWEDAVMRSNEESSKWDANGHPIVGRESAMSILSDCGPTPVTVLAGDIHMAASVMYDDYGVFECSSPAAVNDVFWRLSFFERNKQEQDVFGNELRLLAVYNVPQSLRNKGYYPDRTETESDMVKHQRGDGFLMFTQDDNVRTCTAHGYRTSTNSVFWQTTLPVGGTVVVPPPPPPPPPPPSGGVCWKVCGFERFGGWICRKEKGCHGCEDQTDVCEKLCRRCETKRVKNYGGLDCQCDGDESPTEPPEEPPKEGNCFADCRVASGKTWICQKDAGCEGCGNRSDVCGKLCERCGAGAFEGGKQVAGITCDC